MPHQFQAHFLGTPRQVTRATGCRALRPYVRKKKSWKGLERKSIFLELPKPGCLQFLRGSALLCSFAPCGALLRTCVCALSRSCACLCELPHLERPQFGKLEMFDTFSRFRNFSGKFSISVGLLGPLGQSPCQRFREGVGGQRGVGARKSLTYHRFRPFFCTLFPTIPHEKENTILGDDFGCILGLVP